MTTEKVRTQIIGAAGEALVTYKLLKREIDSARMTTDAGVDLVMYIPGIEGAATIQVKAQWEPVPAGGTGAPQCSWVFDRDCPADWLAVVDLSRDVAWMFEMQQARTLAQQKPDSGKWRIYWYADNAKVSGNPRRESDMAAYEIDVVVKGIKVSENVEPRG
ncbi:hypothetical protein [Mycobacterium sp. Z3061]|uniref:hypothetical protein n=1 Tax=Mycobacterium sp. Z3061 TaxID=3073562 RepID=UPI002873A7E0|nr:hypothetical protein [Mycobacterium sp. Z3061]